MITSLSNPHVKFVNSLKLKKNRDQQACFLIEGSKLFGEAYAWHIPIIEIYHTEKWFSRATSSQLACFDQFMAEHPSETYMISEEVLLKMATQKKPEGIICVAQKRIKLPQELFSCVLLEDVQDPGNVGTIIRTADAAGFRTVILTGKTADLYNEKVIRASMGSIFHVDVIEIPNVGEAINLLKNKTFTIIGSALDGEEDVLIHIPERCRIALIVGNESKGMTAESKGKCDYLVRLPMFGHAESLNAAVAAGILMYDCARKKIKNR